MGKYGLTFLFDARRFCSVSAGVWGSPLCSKMHISPQGERGIFEGCVYTQPVLAIRGKLPVGSLQVLGCVGRMPKINMDVISLN